MNSSVAIFHNPPASNNNTASRHPYPPYRCAVCGRFRYNYDGHCMMGIGLWGEWKRHLGRVCTTCQHQLWLAKAVTVGFLTGTVLVKEEYRLLLRNLHASQRENNEGSQERKVENE